MNSENFARWALDPARTVEERYTAELLVERGVTIWNSLRKIYRSESIDDQIERQRHRSLNPAYQPSYTEENVRKTAEIIPQLKHWSTNYNDRPVRDVQALRFFTHLEYVHISSSEIEDISAFAEMPHLAQLYFDSRLCEDYRPLGRCAPLRDLHLTFRSHHRHPKTAWPNLDGLEQLQLESLTFQGNLLAFGRNVIFPTVRKAVLRCEPLFARSVRELPQLPSCHFLTLAGVERLDGIEAFSDLRNLVLETDVRDFAPLEALRKLTCFTCNGFEPLDLKPLTRLPKLHFASFNANFNFANRTVKTRDFLTLIDSPSLREVQVTNCPPVETEVAALTAGLTPCDDLFLREEPRPISSPRLIVGPWKVISPPLEYPSDADGVVDVGLRACEGRWTSRFIQRAINKKLGCEDWGSAEANGQSRQVMLMIESFSVVEKLPEILTAAREAMARLRYDYKGTFNIFLKAPKLEPTPAQVELEKQFRNEQDEADYERRRAEEAEYLERLHRYELKKQQGELINPEEFAPGEQKPLPPPPWEREDEEEEDSGDPNSGDIAVKKKPEPPPSWFDDDEHPLAGNYRTIGRFDLENVWGLVRDQSLIVYLMRREPDEIIPEEEKIS